MRQRIAFTAALALLLGGLALTSQPSVAAVCPPFSGPAALGGTPTNTVYLPNITKALGGPGGWVTPFIVQNIDVAPTNLELSFYRFSDGCLIARRIVSGLQSFRSFADIPNNDADLPADTQFSVVVRSFGGTVVSVVNEVQGSGATFQGLSYAGTSSGATTVYLPNVTRRFFGYDVPFIIQDLGPAQAHATVRFVSFDGTLTYTMNVNADPQQSAVVDPNFLPAWNGSANSGLRDGTQYAVTVTSDQPVAVVVNAHNETGAPVAYSHNGLATGAATLYAPYAAKNADGVGRFSPIVVQNLGTASVSPTLTFTPLVSASGTGYPPSLANDNPCPVLSGFRCYTFTVTSGGAPLPGVCLAITSASDPNSVGCPNPHYTTDAQGVAKVGTLAADADVFFLYPGKATVGPIHVTQTGTTAVSFPSGSQQVFSLGPIAAGASKAFDPRFTLGTTTPCSGASSTCLGDGVFTVVADAPGGQIAMVVLPVSDATAAAYTATPAPSNKAFLPNVTRTLGGASGYTTPIYLQSAGVATGATLQWYRFSDGQLVVTQTVTMSASGGAAVDPRNVAGLSDDTQYAVVATGTGGTIYGIVFELAFTGGDAAFIYEGFPGQ
jgi:hypothetical protein